MLLKLPITRKVRYSHWIENNFPKKFGVRKVSVMKYVTFAKAMEAVDLPADIFLNLIKHSKEVHAVMTPYCILIHPDGLSTYFRKKLMGTIKRAFLS